MDLDKNLKASFNLKAIRQDFIENGSENRVLFKLPTGDRIEVIIFFKHLHGLSEWNPAQWCKINEIPHHSFDTIMEILGNGDEQLGIEIFDELIADALDQDRFDFNAHLIDLNLECGGI